MKPFLIAVALVCCASLPALAAGKGKPAPASATAAAEKCEHGVKAKLCTRCDPRLGAVFKAKGDWCAEHERAESQCVKCHPDLAKKGIK